MRGKKVEPVVFITLSEEQRANVIDVLERGACRTIDRFDELMERYMDLYQKEAIGTAVAPMEEEKHDGPEGKNGGAAFERSLDKLTQEELDAIALASKSDDPQMRNYAYAFVLASARFYIANEVKRYCPYGGDAKNDFYSEAMGEILRRLPYYDSSNRLSTFLHAYLSHVFMLQRNSMTKEDSSKYYNHIGMTINKAKNYLIANGNPNPSDGEIASCAQNILHKDLSREAVTNYFKQHHSYTAYDESLDSIPSDFETPEAQFIKNEKIKEFYEIINKELDSESSEIMKVRLEYLAEYGKDPSIEELLKAFRAKDPTATRDLVKYAKANADNVMRMRFRLRNNRENIRINGGVRNDRKSREERQDIAAAMLNDPEYIFDDVL